MNINYLIINQIDTNAIIDSANLSESLSIPY